MVDPTRTGRVKQWIYENDRLFGKGTCYMNFIIALYRMPSIPKDTSEKSFCVRRGRDPGLSHKPGSEGYTLIHGSTGL
jgi:hypothetical protein